MFKLLTQLEAVVAKEHSPLAGVTCFRHSPDCLIVQVTVMPYVKWSYQFRVQFRLLKV